MLLTDFHIHSICSPDGYHTISEMAGAERDAGMRCICFTDHCDLDNSRTGEYNPGYLGKWDEINAQYKAAVAAYPDMDIRLGFELGAANHNPEQAKIVAALPGLDFIIGSLHNLKGIADFYYLQYESIEHCQRLQEEYLDECLEIAALDCIDVLGHLGYARRYMLRMGLDAPVTMAQHGDKLDTIFKKLIENGRGVEVNCSGFRTPQITDAFPSRELLRRYRELGGEIVTVGSDAHKLSQAGENIPAGLQSLHDAGFRYFTIFKDRKPEFIPIN